jgi:SAM-dependent methyltransferase
MLKRLDSIKSKLRIHLFRPTILSVFLNNAFFFRKGLFLNVKEYAPKLYGRLLDVGCGSMPYKYLFTNVNEYIGLDTYNSGHDHHYSEIDVFYDGNEIPFPKESFDAVFSSEVFEHIFEIDSTIKQIHGILKKEGLLLITVPFVWDEHEVPYDYGRYSSYGVKYLIEKHGFTVLKQGKIGTSMEVIFQLILSHFSRIIETKNKPFNIFLNTLIAPPIIIIGLILSIVLPNAPTLFFGNIVLARKNGEN